MALGLSLNRPPHISFEVLLMSLIAFSRRWMLCALVYTAAATFAIPALAADPSKLREARSGDMLKMVIHDTPQEVTDLPFGLSDGPDLTMKEFAGKYVVVNFWATWCPPCRKEMPSLAELKAQLGSDQFDVITIATMRNSPAKIDQFFKSINVDTLPQYMDRDKGAFARSMGVRGLPTTLIIDPEGHEIARLTGDAHWSDEDAIGFFQTLLTAP